jgi:valyl-tRNA synthetase
MIPFVDRAVPIIADPVVDRAFGTGAVKITPAHDNDDYETGKRHGLPMITVLDDAARINENGAQFAGLDRYEARRQIVEALQARGDLESIKPHEMLIGPLPALRRRRGAAPQDPVVRPRGAARRRRPGGDPLRQDADPARALRQGLGTLDDRDARLERQPPAVVGPSHPGLVLPGRPHDRDRRSGRTEACEVCGRPAAELRQDEDIFDTWFSSGLWPFSTLGWPEKTRDFERFYPGSVMETAYDIIFFWVARMMMLGIHLTGEAPFHTVYLSGLIRDPYGQKMSKTKGNSVDPLETIDEVGADALRFALVNGTAPGNDARLGAEKLENSRNFANKLWNVARFVLGARPASIPAGAPRELPDRASAGPADRWILSRAAATVAAVDRAMAQYAFGDAARSSTRPSGTSTATGAWSWRRSGWATRACPGRARGHVVDARRRARHLPAPAAPDHAVHHRGHLGAAAAHAGDPQAADRGRLADRRGPSAGRRRRGRSRRPHRPGPGRAQRAGRGSDRARGVAAGRRLRARFARPTFEALRPAIERLARARPLRREPSLASIRRGVEGGLSVIAGEIEAVVRPAAKDEAQEERDRARLERELAEAQGLLASARARLANEAFTSKAPAAVVEGARARATELEELVARLTSGWSRVLAGRRCEVGLLVGSAAVPGQVRAYGTAEAEALLGYVQVRTPFRRDSAALRKGPSRGQDQAPTPQPHG